jgi:hypothetical protein
MPVFYASEVAALLGLNRFKEKDEAIFRVISKINKFKPLIQYIKVKTGGQTAGEILESAPDIAKQCLEKAVTAAVASTTQTDIVNTIKTFKKDASEQLLKSALDGEVTTPEFKAAAERIQKKETTLEKEVKKLQETTVVDLMSQEIQKQRGTRMESTVEDAHAASTGKEVSNRGDRAMFDCAEYSLFGYIDGMQDGAILETKNRKRFWKEPPPYDLVQLRCYMKMKGEIDGILLECFPGDSKRETRLNWDDAEWEKIHTGLCNVSSEIGNLTYEEAEMIIRKYLH